MDRASRKKEVWWKNTRFVWALAIAAWGGTFFLGWYARGFNPNILTPKPLRLSGDYQFISPLLACNFSATNAFPQSQSLNAAIQSVISAHEKRGDIAKASVYLGDFKNGQWANVNPSEKYYPSSLSKVPIMMAYLALAESSSTVLDQPIMYPLGSPDLNADQEIKPQQSIVPGKAYTVATLIEYMIKFSDNNAAQLLFDHINPADLGNLYSALQIPTGGEITTSTLDFMTPQQYAALFRTLYNSTYLSHDASEDALKVMSDSSFTQGIVAGVPSSTPVAHKFGIVSFITAGFTSDRELHDCGIIYAPSHPYLLCVMTRGSSDLATMEGTIADISRAAYQAVVKP